MNGAPTIAENRTQIRIGELAALGWGHDPHPAVLGRGWHREAH